MKSFIEFINETAEPKVIRLSPADAEAKIQQMSSSGQYEKRQYDRVGGTHPNASYLKFSPKSANQKTTWISAHPLSHGDYEMYDV